MANYPLSNRKFSWAFAFIWLCWMGVHAWLLHFLVGVNWQIALLDSLVSNLLLGICCLAMTFKLAFYRPTHDTYFFSFIVTMALAGIWVCCSQWLLQLIAPDEGYLLFIKQSWPLRFCFGFLIIGWITVLNLLWYSQEERQQNHMRAEVIEKQSKEAELFKLRQQLQPHFLFNSLNSISALTLSRPEEARHMIQQLSDFLRSSLKKEHQKLVSAREELQLLQLYLDIEKVRFSHRLNTEINAQEGACSLLMPPLLLQPIVENAIKFGLYNTTDSITIKIEVNASPGMLEIRIVNPFDPDLPPQQGTGFGLTSIRRRLYLIFARNDLLETSAEKNIFTSTLKIPQQS
ncbi:histidine kinase [Anseongella ginsenosidimutans]|uniref:Histidine kinase n=1 Tax=Anseongella ginsenosidimutans TaxID=496056 RepID=A0A4R3KUE8_9SPHI|nr:histidine kinase [Anseongella ginsenosidimutans]TCS89029.1 histidine kinase [Anseongella ginsenosidimutans]